MSEQKLLLTKSFKKALEQSRKEEPLDLSEEDFELFSAIQTDGIIKAHQKRLDRPELREEADSRLRKIDWFQSKWLSFDRKDRHFIIDQILALFIPDIEEPEWAGARHLNLDSELEEAKRISFEDGYTKGQQHSIGTDTKLVEEAKKQERERIMLLADELSAHILLLKEELDRHHFTIPKIWKGAIDIKLVDSLIKKAKEWQALQGLEEG